MPVDPKRVHALFLAAVLEQDHALRAALLHRECGADHVLRRRVEALLRAYDQADSESDEPLIPNASLFAGTLTELDESAQPAAASPPA